MTPRLVIVTGLSGAGKTQAVRALEDLGFFCIDNLPPTLISKFAELCAQASGKIGRIALVVDIRGGEFFEAVAGVLEELRKEGVRYEILFLEASDEALVRRFKESRRPHPLNPGGEIAEGIHAERQRLKELRGMAHKVIDTSNLSVAQLKQEINSLFGEDDGTQRLGINILSFGYKYGIPLDADLVIDVRFLPNPHYVSELRPLTGYDQKVREYVFDSEDTREFVERQGTLLEFLIPRYIREGKTTLTIAIGCTGGKHRSVALVNHFGGLLKDRGHRVFTRHRDINQE